MDFEKLLRTWAKTRAEGEESFLFLDVNQKEDKYFLLLWSRPADPPEEEDDTEDDEEEKPLQIGFHNSSITNKAKDNGSE